MKISPHCWIASLIISSVVCMSYKAIADDTCIFSVNTDEVPPSIVLLLDSGAEMEQITWAPAYDNSIDYTPALCDTERVSAMATGAFNECFLNEYGYTLVRNLGNELVKINADLTPQSKNTGIVSPNGLFSIGRSSNVYLPAVPSNSEDEGVIDNATMFRYSKNYLNWIFYYADHSAIDLKLGESNARTRFYYAKKALFTVMKETENKALFGIYYFVNDTGASSAQPLKLALTEPLQAIPDNNTVDPNMVNNINNMATNSYAPLAEGLATVGGYFNSSSAGLDTVDCANTFVIVVTPGLSSEDFGPNLDGLLKNDNLFEPDNLSDYDTDAAGIGEGNIKKDNDTYTIPINYGGSTYLDDVASYLYNNDIGYPVGYQNVYTYTIGFMGNAVSNLFLINTSNNGNGNLNLYDTTDPEYGKYHFTADDPDQLAGAILAAINNILNRTSSFAAPVVPVTRTTSGNRLYMSFFTPGAENFWEGNVIKFGLSPANEIIDKNGDLATWPNGALKEDAVPFWSTIDWARDSSSANPAANGVLYSARNIYTYLQGSSDIRDSSNEFNVANMTDELLGTPTHTLAEIVDYVRGGDPFDEDQDNVTSENRDLITGDVLHSEPLVYEYIHSSGSLTLSSVTGVFIVGNYLVGDKGGRAIITGVNGSEISYNELSNPFLEGETVIGKDPVSGAESGEGIISAPPYDIAIFYGANDGMLHAVNDVDGTESWAFIPPNQLSRLKDIVEGAGHSYFVDSSPKIYKLDINDNGSLDTADGDKVILVSGERKGSNSYFALDVTDPWNPLFLWRVDELIFPELGESWSEPTFGRVKTNNAASTPVVIIGGGYRNDNSAGKAILFLNILDGSAVKIFENGALITDMNYSIASQVRAIDLDGDGLRDKAYVGDLGGQIWRLGHFPDPFPKTDNNIDNWNANVLFNAGADKKFFYPPSVTLERGYDLVFSGTGDRDNPCDKTTHDIVFAVKDNHNTAGLITSDLVNVTDPTATPPNLDGSSDAGWYIELGVGEKMLAEPTIFYKIAFFTTFTPNDDPCVPGGLARLYLVNYKTGAAVMDSGTRSIIIGGGIPSKPVLVISQGEGGGDGEEKMLISVGSTLPDEESESQDAGIFTFGTGASQSFYYLWWNELFN